MSQQLERLECPWSADRLVVVHTAARLTSPDVSDTQMSGWITYGLLNPDKRRVKLEALLFASRYYTRRSWVEAFVREVTGKDVRLSRTPIPAESLPLPINDVWPDPLVPDVIRFQPPPPPIARQA